MYSQTAFWLAQHQRCFDGVVFVLQAHHISQLLSFSYSLSAALRIAMHCILLTSNILRVIWIFTLQWGGRFAPHSWDRPDWAHCSWFDCSILILFSTNTACVLVTNMMYECLSHPYFSAVHCCRFIPFKFIYKYKCLLEASSGLLTSSFAPFGRSGCVTHATVQWLDSALAIG